MDRQGKRRQEFLIVSRNASIMHAVSKPVSGAENTLPVCNPPAPPFEVQPSHDHPSPHIGCTHRCPTVPLLQDWELLAVRDKLCVSYLSLDPSAPSLAPWGTHSDS